MQTRFQRTTPSLKMEILAFLNDHDYVVRSDVDVLLKVSQATANRLLKRMVAEGLLYQDSSGRNTKYRKK